MPEESRTIDAVQTTCDIVEFLNESGGAGITEIADHVDRSKGTVHCHLATLRQNELVVRDGDVYQLGFRFLDLAESSRNRLKFTDIVREELEDLAEETGEIVQFAVEEHGLAVYIEKIMGENAVQSASHVGSREYLHCLALGKAILAHLPRMRTEEIIDRHGLPERTENTVTDRDELYSELEEIRERGYAIDEGEKIEGLRCVATPVMGATGDVIGAISITGPSSRVEVERVHEELSNRVIKAANVIEINIEYS